MKVTSAKLLRADSEELVAGTLEGAQPGQVAVTLTLDDKSKVKVVWDADHPLLEGVKVAGADVKDSDTGD